jgi:predicted MPP superfamily phosphohydrolase
VFFPIALILLTSIYGYGGWRLSIHLPWPWNAVWAFSVAILALSPLLAVRMRERTLWRHIGDLYAWVSYGGFGFFITLTGTFILRDLSGALLQWAGIELPATRAQLDAVTLVASCLFTLWGLYQARRTPSVRNVEIAIDGLPKELAGLRIAHLSDLHVGPTIKRDFVQRIVDRTNALQPDLIVFTGDMADGPVERLKADVEPLAALRAPLGLFSITGNHEYYSGVHDWTAQTERLGFRVLINDSCLIERGKHSVALVGITDFSAEAVLPDHRSDPLGTLTNAPKADLTILLAHQPRSVHAAGGADLQLSGHTHGGQFIPWKYIVPLQQTYLAGLHRHESTWIYVHSGCGYWGPPLRLGAPSEIALHTIRSTS